MNDAGPISTLSLHQLLARRRPNFSLEAPFYTSPEIFKADIDIIFHRHWIYVGIEPDVPEPGDVVTVSVGDTSVLIVRDDDMAVRAFHNVCRHRGARLVTDERTSVGNLVCKYHQWTYGLTGELLYAEHMGDGFDKSCRGLKPVHLKNIAGLLFICLAENPPADIEEMAAVMTPYIAPHQVANTKIAYQADLIEPGNWKLTMENNRECYHCSVNHPELTIPLFANSYGFVPGDELGIEQARRYDEMVAERTASWEGRGLPSREVDHLADRVTGFRTQRMPLDGTGQSQTMDTLVACRKLLGGFNDPALGGLSFWTQPNSWHHFMSDHIVTFSALPLDAGRTLVRTKWLVHKDAVEGEDYDVENLTTVWKATNQQDSDLVGLGQLGVVSPAYEPGPYSPNTEYLVEKFIAWYVDRMSEHVKA